MKKIYIVLLLGLYGTLGMFGQTTNVISNVLPMSMERQIMTLIDNYCVNIEKLSSTSGKISNEEKTSIRRDEMPKFFYQYEMRRVYIETQKGQRIYKMQQYLSNLQLQTEMNRPGMVRKNLRDTEELVFVFYTNMELNIPQTAFIDGGNINAEYRLKTPEPIIMVNDEGGKKRERQPAVKSNVTRKDNIIIYHIWNAKDKSPFMLLGNVYIYKRK